MASCINDISIKRKHTWPWIQCVPFRLINMRRHTVNVCNVVVKNVQVLSCPINNRKDMTQTCVQQYVFMLTEYYHAVL